MVEYALSYQEYLTSPQGRLELTIMKRFQDAENAHWEKNFPQVRMEMQAWRQNVAQLFILNEKAEAKTIDIVCSHAQKAFSCSSIENTAMNTWERLVCNVFRKRPQEAMSHVLTYIGFADPWIPVDRAKKLEKLFAKNPRTQGAACRVVSLLSYQP